MRQGQGTADMTRQQGRPSSATTRQQAADAVETPLLAVEAVRAQELPRNEARRAA